jgi:hypothetical protein
MVIHLYFNSAFRSYVFQHCPPNFKPLVGNEEERVCGEGNLEVSLKFSIENRDVYVDIWLHWETWTLGFDCPFMN